MNVPLQLLSYFNNLLAASFFGVGGISIISYIVKENHIGSAVNEIFFSDKHTPKQTKKDYVTFI